MKRSYSVFYSFGLILPFVGSSIYLPSIGVALFPLLGYFLLVLYLVSYGLTYDKAICAYGLLFFIAALSLIQSTYWVATKSIDIRINAFAGVALGGTFFLCVRNLFQRTKAYHLDLSLKLFLLLILLFFYVQFLGQFLLDFKVDFLKPFTGEGQRLASHGVTVERLGAFARTSGIFAEPAVHAYMTNIVLTALIYRKSVSNLLFFLALCSIWLSLSASGMALSLIPIFIKLGKGVKREAVGFLIVALMALVYLETLSDIFGAQISRVLNWQSDASAIDRLRFIDFFNDNPVVFFFGYGFFTDIRLLSPPAGFWVSLIVHLGLPMALVSLLLIAYVPFKELRKRTFCIFALLALFFGYPVSSPFFWISYTLLYVSMRVYSQSYENSFSFNLNRPQDSMLPNSSARPHTELSKL